MVVDHGARRSAVVAGSTHVNLVRLISIIEALRDVRSGTQLGSEVRWSIAAHKGLSGGEGEQTRAIMT